MLVPVLVLSLAAAQAPAPSPPTQNMEQPVRRLGRPFVSPMGEPFRGDGPSGDGLVDWFNQADRNHDGLVTADEMQADAQRFFASLDIDKDGEIGPDEIDRYETVIAPEVHGEPVYAPKPDSSQQVDPDPDGDGSDLPTTSAGRGGGAGRFGLLNIPEPVAAADADLSRGITLDEFRRAALDRFALLDTGHRGGLTIAQLQAMRPSSVFGRHGGGERPSGGGHHRHGGWRGGDGGDQYHG